MPGKGGAGPVGYESAMQRSVWRCWSPAALCVTVLTLAMAGCQMPHLQQRVAQPDGRPADTDEDAPGGKPDGTSEIHPPVVGLPALAVADVAAAEDDGTLIFTVSLSYASADPLTVRYATENGTATAGSDYGAVSGILTFPADSIAARTIQVAVRDDAVDEPDETFTIRFSNPQGATLATDTATGTITDDDARSVTVWPAALNVAEGASGSYTVALSSQPTTAVTVLIATAAEVSASPQSLAFPPGDWAGKRTVTVTAEHDDDAVADAPVELMHTVRGGDYEGAAAPPVTVTIVEIDTQSLAVAGANAAEAAGVLRFAVSLSLASAAAVTADYATGAAGDTATEGEDYRGTRGTLTFPPHATAARMIEVRVTDDAVDEPDEQFTVTLSRPVNATLAGGGATTTATGTIENDDEPPRVSVADAVLNENGGRMRFVVTLDRESARTVTVRYATADVTATAGADYTPAGGTLTFAAGTRERTIEVPVANDDLDEDDAERFTVTLSAAVHATVDAAGKTATGTIADDDKPPLVLAALQVSGGGAMYPTFDPDVRHYALTCEDSTTLQVTAQARRNGATLTLLRAGPADNQVSTRSLDTHITVNDDHDVAIELTDDGSITTYVVHCLPPDFPDIRILKKTDSVPDGLLFVTPRYGTYGNHVTFTAILDYNGVPRFHRKTQALFASNFRRHADNLYSVSRTIDSSSGSEVHLLDGDFQATKTVRTVGSVTSTDFHDFLITPGGNYLLIAYNRATRDFSEYGASAAEEVRDSVIQEVTPEGKSAFVWNSWDHRDVMNLGTDCNVGTSPGEYAHLNSLQLIDGDLIASFRDCAQVLRIDWSGLDKGAVQWKLGGTAPPSDSGTEHLEIVGDDDANNEFCGQHHATLTARGKLILFDNGVGCLGDRKATSPFTRVVEYDVSSGTHASYVREFRLSRRYGYAHIRGGATVLGINDRWLIAWNHSRNIKVSLNETIAVSEVDPGTDIAHFHMHMSKDGNAVSTYRVYREREADVTIPLNLP